MHYCARVLKVNHAGEHGAVNIYAGQMLAAHITARWMRAELAKFKSHEQRHLATFEAELLRQEFRAAVVIRLAPPERTD
jgi:ubiquinone biosynthesis monooxygenase Coq7